MIPYRLRILQLLILVLPYPDGANAQPSADDRRAIQSIMDEQTRCWNEGDLECFMAGYWHSDSLMFIGSEITYGYDSTLARYRRRYPDRASMGNLRFEIVSLEFLSGNAALMVGKWFLQRSVGDISGHYTLLFRQVDGQWRIVKDHSS